MDIEKGILCPVCNGEVEWDDCYDDHMENGKYICRCGGTCVQCQETIEYNIIYPLGEATKVIIDHYKL